MIGVAWIVFYPELRTPLSFHFFRHFFLVLFIFIAIRADPCFFSVFLAILSILDYTRRTSSRWLFPTYLSISAGFYLGAHLSPGLSFVTWTFIRSTFLSLPFLFDRFFVRKVGLSRIITDFAFPVVLAACNQLGTRIDPLGIATNIASFCNDYPDFTFLPLRIGGAPFLVAFIGFLAALTSRWRSTRTLPKSVFTILFKLIPTLTVMIYVGRCLGAPSRVIHIGGAVAAADTSCGAIVTALSDLTKLNDVIGLGGILRNCTENDIGKLTLPHSSYIFASDNHTVFAFGPNGTVSTMASAEIGAGLRGRYSEPLFLDTPIGRILVLTDRQILRTEYYTAVDADLIVSVHGLAGDELNHLPLMNAMVVSQATGATRIHFSAFADSFLVNADGHAGFTEEFQEEAVYTFSHAVKVAPNAIGGCRLRTQIAEFAILGAGVVTVIGAFFPRSVLLSISRVMSSIFHLKSA
jgi:hypothetical protein